MSLSDPPWPPDIGDNHPLEPFYSLSVFGRMAIYAIGPETGCPLKIGIAGAPQARLTDLQCGNWQPLKIHVAICLGNRKHAVKVERIVHLILKDRRMIKEWFDISTDQFTAVVSEAIVQARRRVDLPAWPNGRN